MEKGRRGGAVDEERPGGVVEESEERGGRGERGGGIK